MTRKFTPHKVFLASTPALSSGDDWLRRMIEDHARREEAVIRELLGQWVSELEPRVLRGPNLQIVGLTINGLAVGQEAPVVIANPHYRERRVWNPTPEKDEWP